MKSPELRKTTNELGVLLRHWRDVRGKSQLDLSLDTGVSQKQISFVESGRSVPSRFTLAAIAGALDIPLRDRNTLLLAAGYAPVFPDGPWDSIEMKSVTDALKRILRQHEPFPALVMDRYWNVFMTNECAPRFFNCFIDMAARRGPRKLRYPATAARQATRHVRSAEHGCAASPGYHGHPVQPPSLMQAAPQPAIANAAQSADPAFAKATGERPAGAADRTSPATAGQQDHPE